MTPTYGLLVGLLAAWFRTRDPALLDSAAPLYCEWTRGRTSGMPRVKRPLHEAAHAAGLNAHLLDGQGVYSNLTEALNARGVYTGKSASQPISAEFIRRKYATQASAQLDRLRGTPAWPTELTTE